VATVDLFEERRRRRRAGDPRVTESDRQIMRRITTGDLADDFQAVLDAAMENDPFLGGPGFWRALAIIGGLARDRHRRISLRSGCHR
jgi:hypothetical protein